MMDTMTAADAARGAPFQGGAIDCDVHVDLPGVKTLLPYLDPYWRDYVTVRGVEVLDPTGIPAQASHSCRPDWAGDVKDALARMQRDLLDHFDLRFAICNCIWGAQGLFNEHLAAALCRAANDWLAEEWLSRDPRLRASVMVPWQNPVLAAEEINRRADDSRFVQVLLLAMGDMLLGRPHYWPIYEAAQRCSMPIGVHAGSAYRHAPTSIGWPSYVLEDYVAQAPAFQMQATSLISEGALAQFADLRVVFIEGGITWIPTLMWRAGKIWRAMRMEVPWVQQVPSNIIRDRFRFTTQPFDAPADPAVLRRVLEQMGSDHLLLFSTDYPHWHFEGDAALPPGLPPALMQRVLIDNALETYPRLKGDIA